MYKSKRFERWFAQWTGLSREDVSNMWDVLHETYISREYTVGAAWEGWKAARTFEKDEE